VDSPNTRSILLAVALAGLLAGLVTGVFHYFATEPVIEDAIALEARAHPALDDEPPVVSREAQRVGLLVGWLGLGLFWGLGFGAVYALVRPRPGRAGQVATAVLAALAAYWFVALFPALKYPANPPGVGDPATIGYRQVLHLLFWVLSIGGLLVAAWTYRLTRRGRAGWRPWAAALGVYAIYAGLLYAFMPPNPDPVELPADLVLRFRVLSVAGLGLLWLVLGVAFGLFLHSLERAPVRRGA
jgi:predicted cobalt transporter CbtA